VRAKIVAMTQDFTTNNPAGSVPPGGRHDLRNLRRSRDDRMIGGVCGGLGRYLGIDPVILRIVLAALAIFGGIGLLLYALAWLLVAEDGSDTSEAQRLFRGRATPLTTVAAIVVGTLGVLALTDIAYHGHRSKAVVFILLAVIVVIALNRRHSERIAASHGRPTATPYAAPTAPTAMPYTATPYAAPSTGASYAPPVPGNYAPLGPPAGFAPSRPLETPVPPAPPKAPKPPRQPSVLGPLALSAGIVVVGVLFALDAAHAIDISAQAVFAAALLTVGIALIIGTWIGRARALIAAGVILTVALAATAALDVPLRGGIGVHNDTPLALSDLPATYHLGIGNQTVDLTQLKTGGKTVQVAASVGLGQLRVFVPGDAVVKVHGRVGAGDLRLLGTVTNGTHLNRNVVLDPQGPTVAGAGELDLDLRVGMGDVEVIQLSNTAPVPVLPTPRAPEVPQ
jgi:phage shock protein PspC (stress-responsive transcriptional regulator)/predicted membrane protein